VDSGRQAPSLGRGWSAVMGDLTLIRPNPAASLGRFCTSGPAFM